MPQDVPLQLAKQHALVRGSAPPAEHVAPKKQASQASWRGPKNYQRSDERIKEDVCECLRREHAIDTSDVSVDVHDAIVVLEGIVPARPMKHAIENIASVCVGVRDVEN